MPPLPPLRLVVLAALCAAAGHGRAQTPPDAGQILRDVQPARPAARPAEADGFRMDEAERPAPPDAGELRFRVSNISFAGVSAIPIADLIPLVGDAMGREVTLADLHRLAQRITRHYRDRGYLLARAYVPAQEIRGGAVEIAVQEGRIGRVELHNHSRLEAVRVGALFRDLGTGVVISSGSVERKALLLAETPGVEAQTTLRPGATTGTSDLVVEVRDGPRVVAEAALDNHGQKYTGRGRLSGAVGLNNPAGFGDLLSLRGMTTGKGLTYGRLGYQIPFTLTGPTLGVAWSRLDYELGREFAALQADGRASAATVSASYPLLRTRDSSLTAVLSHDARRLEDRTAGTAAERRLGVTALGLNGAFADSLGGPAITRYAVSLMAGNLSIRSADALAVDTASARTQGRYTRVVGSIARDQSLNGPWSLYLALNGQAASKNLDSSEKMALGGPYAVRAYPMGEAPGDQGVVATLETRYAIRDNLRASVFVDAGEVRVNKEAWGVGANRRSLAGAGVGLGWQGAHGLSVLTHVAWRIDGETSTTDADRSPRFWLQLATVY